MSVRIPPRSMWPPRQAAQSDVRFLLQREEVPEDLQLKIYHVGLTSIGRFSAFVGTSAELKSIMNVEFGLDADNALADRVTLSK